MAHLTKQDRCKIENFLNAGLKLKEIANKLSKSHTTIAREIRKHRQEEDPDRRKLNNYCVFSRRCSKKGLCRLPPSNCMGKCSSCRIVSCNKLCSDFEEDRCSHLERAPFVCNGCPDLKGYRKRKFFYFALEAMDEYRTELVDARQGIDSSPGAFTPANETRKKNGITEVRLLLQIKRRTVSPAR